MLFRYATDLPTRLYRYFPELWQADALLEGKVWLSTLSACRGYEDADRGDPEEASLRYSSGIIHGNGASEEVQVFARRARAFSGFKLLDVDDSVQDLTLKDNVVSASFADAYVLCLTSDEAMPSGNAFGDCGIAISDSVLFFRLLTIALREELQLDAAVLAAVTYASRTFVGADSPPGMLGFVKPRHYEWQREFRMLWLPTQRDARIQPFELQCSAVARLCNRIV